MVKDFKPNQIVHLAAILSGSFITFEIYSKEEERRILN